ncbi:Helix-loop-helix DNA-binding domain superfamily [Arabidopsis suecica]|uniref:Helix-loop-helix DNA-binding domain superfamily n=1 Tax=Arabidopsis suecica TaxID=45249 RepID=A0A8T2BQ01_ARASU|nr:Helix-loop-helix DNA-binding domain superfamily [Arabidopsis suecica]
MDFIPSMFMPDSTYEDGLLFSDSFLLSPFISYQNNDVCNPITNKIGGSNKKRSLCDTYGVNEANKNDDDRESKKVKHRDIERQRRQEVSSLFKSLRTLLPFQYIQGKRSTSDHIFQAVNYIKDLQTKIKELNEKRNQIKKSLPGTSTTLPSIEECTSSLSSTSTLSSSCSCVGDKHITVVVTPCLVGVEIILSCCLGRNKSCLSSVLQMLAQEQRLSVVSCLSSRRQQRFMHTIVSQVEDGKQINILELKDKIMNM